MQFREIPEQVVKKILMSTLLKSRDIGKNQFQEKLDVLENAIKVYLSGIETGFVSNNSKEFKEYLESEVGEVEFTKPFAVRLRSDSVRLFVAGTEIK